ncbi:Angio-associated migratory cell protein [Echinococcus granulosus]|uniref:Angio associated migratory cell protein n=1 Tax=Echinococcus granulosus TaxID=6210 RepID=A0A068WLL1_ECHGR|nr:Angio-associated migratory cell protein [Echinococcus granulosus]CDS20659.1 angio associated migratory cell protein [Echinococcus granulosus]
MSPYNSPTHTPPDWDPGTADDEDYLVESEPFEIVEAPSDRESVSDGEGEMQETAPITDNSKLVLKKHKDSVFCVDVHPNGRILATGSQDHTAVVWDLTTASDLFTCTGHEDSVICVNFSPGNGQYLATGDMAGSVQIWRLGSSASSPFTSNGVAVTPHRSLSLSELIWLRWWQLPTSTAGKRHAPLVLFTGSEDGLVSASLVTTASGGDERPPKYLMGSGSAVVGAAVVPSTYATERPFLAVVGRDGDFRVWDLKSEMVLLHAIIQTPSSSSRRQQDDENGEDVEMEDEERNESTSGYLCMAAPQPNTPPTSNIVDIVAVAGYETIVFVPCRPPPSEEVENGPKKIPTNALTSVALEGAGTVEAMQFCTTHPFLAFGTVAGQVGVFDTSCMRMRQLWTYSDPTTGTDEGFGITALRWSRANPLTFFTATLAATVVGWSAAGGGTPLVVWRGHSEAVLDIALSVPMGEPPREEFIASASDDTTVRIYDMAEVANLPQ